MEGLQNQPFDCIELFNTILGLMNYEANTGQQEEQRIMHQKIDLILKRLEAIERRGTSDTN